MSVQILICRCVLLTSKVTGSGVQIGPNIIDEVSKMYTWFRNKTYVLPPPNQRFSAVRGANFKCM